jgi:hypothetical protein
MRLETRLDNICCVEDQSLLVLFVSGNYDRHAMHVQLCCCCVANKVSRHFRLEFKPTIASQILRLTNQGPQIQLRVTPTDKIHFWSRVSFTEVLGRTIAGVTQVKICYNTTDACVHRQATRTTDFVSLQPRCAC